jgi:HlyD family secretion protein
MKLNQRAAILLAGGAIVVLVAAVAFFVAGNNAQDTAASTIETSVVRRGTLTATVNATGAISPLREAALAFNTSGALTKLQVKQGDMVKTGQLLANLDTRTLELQLAQAEANLAAAQARLDQLKNPSPADVAAAQASVASAEAALAQLKTPTQTDLTIAKSDLDKAQAAVARAQAEYDRIGGANNPLIAMTPQALALQQATLDYQKALAIYTAKTSPTDSQLKQAQAAVEQARAQLIRLTNPSPADLSSAQANIDQARAARDLAKVRLEDTILRAPFDGIVTRVDLDLGSFVAAGRVVITVADASELRVKLSIDETDIARVKVGQEVAINLDAYPDVTIKARVTDVAAVATLTQGVVTYLVTVTLTPEDVPVKIGMTANANIVVAHRENVLLVPNRAVRALGNKRLVTVPRGQGQTEDVEVKLGMANDQETEVVSGVSEGQPLVISNVQSLNPALSPFGGRR